MPGKPHTVLRSMAGVNKIPRLQEEKLVKVCVCGYRNAVYGLFGRLVEGKIGVVKERQR